MRKRWLFLVAAGALFVSISAASAQVPFHNNELVVDHIDGPMLTVHFIDVGQGDAILFQAPNGETLLVDTGPKKKIANPLPYLKEVGVARVDHLMITHSHLDHIGGFQRIAKELPIGEFLWAGYFHPTRNGERFLEKIEELKVPIRKLKRGDKMTLGKDGEIKVTVLHPPEDMKPVDHDINNFSLVIRVSFGDIDFLLTGDAEIKAERMVMASNLPLASEFLKVGHHGSKTATTLTFLRSVGPAFGVISCGRNNKYGHPHDLTLDNLEEANVTILRTDDVGTIVVRTDGKKVSINLKGRRVSGLLLPLAVSHSFIIIGRREDDEALDSMDNSGCVLDDERRFRRAA